MMQIVKRQGIDWAFKDIHFFDTTAIISIKVKAKVFDGSLSDHLTGTAFAKLLMINSRSLDVTANFLKFLITPGEKEIAVSQLTHQAMLEQCVNQFRI